MYYITMSNCPEYTSLAQLSRRIKALRLTQKEISMAVGVTQSQISRILSGTTSARSKAYARLCIYVSRRPASVSTREINENEDITEAIATVWDLSLIHI